MVEPARRGPIVRLTRWLARRSQAPALPLMLPVFPATDFVFPVMPNQLLLVALSMLAPERWLAFALAFAVGGAIGGAAIAVAIQSFGLDIGKLLGPLRENADAARVFAAIRENGLWFMAAVALLPWTPRLTVLVCAALGIAPLAIGLTLVVTRLVPACALALIGAKSPKLALRSPWVRKFIAGLGELPPPS